MKNPKELSDYWFPHYPSRWKRKTMKLCPFQDGLYLRLRDHYMETKEPLPDDDAALARICGISPADFAPHAAKIRPFFTPKKGFLFNKTCEEVLNFQNGAEHRRKEKAKKGGKTAQENRKKKQGDKFSENFLEESQDELGSTREQNITEENRTEEIKKTCTKDTDGDSPEKPNASGGALVPRETNFSEYVELWNAMADGKGLAKCQKLSKSRASKLRARLKDCGGLEGWKVALEKVAASAFLTGGTERPFHATIDFLLKEEKFTKIMEGAYDNRKSTFTPKQSAHDAMSTGFDTAVDILDMADARERGR